MQRAQPINKKQISDDESDDELPGYQNLQGMDGRSYRVPISTHREHRNALHGYSERKEPQYTVVRGRDGRLYRMSVPPIDDVDSPGDEMDLETVSETASIQSDLKEENNSVAGKKKKQKGHQRKKVTIIVEDASDSENDDDTLNSPWQHRRPSPGQWMEPVEAMKV